MSNVIQGTDEWFAMRCGVATASRFADILAKGRSGEAVTRASYKMQLVGERITQKVEESYSSPAMLRGTELEPIARAAYMFETGAEVQEGGFTLHPTLKAGASPDGRIGSNGGIEIKCPVRSTFLEYLRMDREPPKYKAQIQGQMWICGFEWVDFVSYHPDFPSDIQLIVRRIYRDEEYIANLESEVAKFLDEVERDVQIILKKGNHNGIA